MKSLKFIIIIIIIIALAAMSLITLTAAGADVGKELQAGSSSNMTISASDPNGDVLSFAAADLPPGATFDTDTHVFSWTPNYAQEGVYIIRFTVTDPGGLSDYEDVTITVTSPYPDWDVNWDGATNILDLIAIGQHFGERGPIGWSPIDANEDGVVNVLDLILVSNKF
jgi:hypothetical protein